ARAGLPTSARIPAATWGLLARDKKARAGRVRWILPRGVGRFSVVGDVDARTLAWAASALEGRR
ncbi:MAG: 3-dehydroquinate synthase, partial [Candidatus Limnocylindria bacterium]